MIYTIPLIFDNETNNQIKNFYSKIKDNLSIEFEIQKNSIPHATIIKFESQKDLTKTQLDKIIRELTQEIKIDFSGITFLPSRSEGCWIELSILKTQQLAGIQDKLISRLREFEILSGTKDRFRPHITFSKTNDCNASFKKLSYNILRKKQVKANVVVGIPGETFEFKLL